MLNLYHLKYFLDAADRTSLTKAAQLNFISASAISQSIRQLEQSLGCALIEHNQNRFQLTLEGRKLQEKGRHYLDLLESLKTEVKHADEVGSGEFTLSTTNILAQIVALPSIARLCEQHKALNPKLKIGGSSYIFRSVENREAELGLAMEDGTKTTLKKENFRKGKFKLFMNKSHRGKNWEDQKIWLTNFEFEGKEFESQFVKKFKKRPQWGFQLESWTLVSQVVSEGMGVGLLPDFMEKAHPHLVPVKTNLKLMPFELNFYFRENEKLSKNCKLFIHHLHEFDV